MDPPATVVPVSLAPPRRTHQVPAAARTGSARRPKGQQRPRRPPRSRDVLRTGSRAPTSGSTACRRLGRIGGRRWSWSWSSGPWSSWSWGSPGPGRGRRLRDDLGGRRVVVVTRVRFGAGCAVVVVVVVVGAVVVTSGSSQRHRRQRHGCRGRDRRLDAGQGGVRRGSTSRLPRQIPAPTARATTTAPVPISIRPRVPRTAAGSRVAVAVAPSRGGHRADDGGRPPVGRGFRRGRVGRGQRLPTGCGLRGPVPRRAPGRRPEPVRQQRPAHTRRGSGRTRPAAAAGAAGGGAGGWAAGVPRIAAPSATSCFGWLSSASGRPNAADSISLTSGIRDEPPTSTMADRSPGSTPAELEHPPRRRHRLADRRAQHVVELAARQPHRGRDPRQRDRHHRVDAERQHLLGLDAVAPQPRQPGGRRRIQVVERGHVRPERREDVPEHGLVEVDATQLLDALRRPGQAEPRPVAGEDGGVERAAAQVVDGDPVALGHPVARRVGDRRRLGLGAGLDAAQAREPDRLAQQVALERAPVRRMRHADVLGRAALPFGGDADHPGQQPRRERLGRERRSADDERHRVADAPLELPHHPRRIRRALLLGGLADDDLAVAPDEHHRRHLHRPDAQPEHLHPAVDVHRRGRVGRAQVDTQPIPHRHPLCRSSKARPPPAVLIRR